MENRKTRLAKKLLKEALLELLEQKSSNKISVSELCKTADLNRSTFYAHYVDISSLIQEIEQEFIDRVPYSSMLSNSYKAAYSEIKYLQDNLRTFQLLLDKGNLTDAFIKKSMEAIENSIEERKNISSERKSTYILALNYTISGFIKSLEYWSYNQTDYTPEQLATLLSEFGRAVFAINIKYSE